MGLSRKLLHPVTTRSQPMESKHFYRAVAQLFSENNLGFGPYSFGGSEGHARSTPIEIRTAASAVIKIKRVGLSSRLARSKVGMLIPQSRRAVQVLVPLNERVNKVERFKANANGVSGPRLRLFAASHASRQRREGGVFPRRVGGRAGSRLAGRFSSSRSSVLVGAGAGRLWRGTFTIL